MFGAGYRYNTAWIESTEKTCIARFRIVRGVVYPSARLGRDCVLWRTLRWVSDQGGIAESHKTVCRCRGYAFFTCERFVYLFSVGVVFGVLLWYDNCTESPKRFVGAEIACFRLV